MKKLKNLPRWRPSSFEMLEELRAMRVSYSQFGEDLVVRSHFQGLDNSQGRFVDVGAFHPFKYSNTMLLSQLGWRGINIDFDAEKVRRFDQWRPQDINIRAALAATSGEMVWIEYPEPTTNRLVAPEDSNRYSALGERPIREIPIQVTTLTEVIMQTEWRDCHFHYLNIDCEGHDLAVLQGMDFGRWSPDLITVEALDDKALQCISAFLGPLGYVMTDRVRLTDFYRKCRSAT